MEFHHISVLLEETIKGLVTDPRGTYVDCTLGGAGHSSRIAALLCPEGRLIGIDQDREAIAAAKERLAGAAAIGPLLQGLRRPFNDVSRGCGVNDLVDCSAMAAITEWVG